MSARHKTIYVNDVAPVDFCGQTWLQVNVKGVFEKPFETNPTDGEHDFNKCEGCQKTLKEIKKRLIEKFEGVNKDGAKPFPFCCPHHSELTKLKEFNRTDFIGVPDMVARKIIYTRSHIKNNHQCDNYYKEVTDYIDYTVDSFGQMPGGAEPLFLSAYLHYVSYYVSHEKGIEKKRRNELLAFLKAYRSKGNKPQTDFNILINTYEKWLKIFPFEISFFSNLKSYFENQLPILNGRPEVNKYSGLAKAKMHTKSSLFEALLNLTSSILTQINTTTLYEEGLLTEPQKIKLELVLNERKMKLKQGYVNSSQDEDQRYRKILKEWFADEKRFIDEITPFLKDSPPKRSNFINNFDKVAPTDIYKHFHAGLVAKGHLTEQELNEYLKAAFELKTIPDTLFKIKDAPSKEKIYLVFYTYYLNVAGKPHKKQQKYVELLGNYFEGYNSETIKTNWAKGYSPKKH